MNHSVIGLVQYLQFLFKKTWKYLQVTLNPGEDDELNCTGFRRNYVKSFFSHFLSILLLGIPYLIGYWKPTWQVYWFRSPASLFTSDTVLVLDPVSGDAEVVRVNVLVVSEDSFPGLSRLQWGSEYQYPSIWISMIIILSISSIPLEMILGTCWILDK